MLQPFIPPISAGQAQPNPVGAGIVAPEGPPPTNFGGSNQQGGGSTPNQQGGGSSPNPPAMQTSSGGNDAWGNIAPDLSTEKGLTDHLNSMAPEDRLQPMWVHPNVVPHLINAFGKSGAVVAHPGVNVGSQINDQI